MCTPHTPKAPLSHLVMFVVGRSAWFDSRFKGKHTGPLAGGKMKATGIVVEQGPQAGPYSYSRPLFRCARAAPAPPDTI